jgi:hypothetical protein
MSPRHQSPDGKTPKKVPPKKGPGMDRDRHLEDARHHPLDHPLPHPPHKTLRKPVLPKDHTTHTRPHEEALGPHTDKPGPITPAKQIIRAGTKNKLK